MQPGNNKKTWLLLASLALAIILVIAIDFIPFSTLFSDKAPVSADTESSESTNLSTDDPSEPITFTLTFTGECAPGSPYGTDAYGSFNALAKEKGISYFLSDFKDYFSTDDMTIIANRCVFSDTLSAVCTAPAAYASMYSDVSVELALNLSDELDDFLMESALPLQNTNVAVVKSDSAHFTRIKNIPITILTATLTNETAPTVIEKVQAAKENAQYLILCFYGGEVNSHVPEDWMTETLHACADAGANLIIGTGTGVLRPVEKYNGTYIAYSLGTLIDGTQLVPENATAIMRCTVTILPTGKTTTEIEFRPAYVYTDLWKPKFMTDEADVSLVKQFLQGTASMPIPVQPN